MKLNLELIAHTIVALSAGLVNAQPTNTGVQSHAPISSAIITFKHEMFTDINTCLNFVDRAAESSNSDVLLFVPTFYWWDDSKDLSWETQSHVTHYCYFATDKAGTACPEISKEQVQQLEDNLTKCFSRAVEKGFNLALTPHLDDGGQKSLWRNGLVFSPEEKHGGLSYYDAYLQPLANAVKRAISSKPDTKVWFGMQGEMSACLYAKPKEWLAFANKLKDEDFEGLSNVYIGANTNFNKLCHCLHVDIVETGLYLTKFKEDFGQIAANYDNEAIAALYDRLDFFGISSYPSLTPNFETRDLEAAAYQFDEESKLFGVDTKALIAKGKQFYFFEYGVGGGQSQHGNETAANATMAARYPFFTVFNHSINPWENKDVNDYRKYYYEQTAKYLSGNAPGAQYKVSGVFTWNLGSYDFQGISTKNFYDEDMVQLVKKHNQAVRQG
ncbi:hypothetical protein MIR68_009312 [Amoeboaphelidium protococcarum]|nr:hypothetical protein MIR68_009312 [Amoeboaphelidium protococcarum]KAI3645935.1 hypothetical protein MP228_008863 [Amoeboaphelidium protococcarum]